MKLNKADKNYLYSMGISVEDVRQIEECIGNTLFYDSNDKRISRKDAIEILGREVWLNGMARSAFHNSAYRENEDGSKSVYFDSSKYFKKNPQLGLIKFGR